MCAEGCSTVAALKEAMSLKDEELEELEAGTRGGKSNVIDFLFHVYQDKHWTNVLKVTALLL
jgi:hypothetical protein